MPARSTSKSKSQAKKIARPAAKKPVAKKKAAAASKTKPGTRKAAAPKRSAKPGTITVGETQYVLGEYGQLMTMDEYERVMGKKQAG